MGPIAKRVLLAAVASASLTGCQTMHMPVNSPCHDTKLTLYYEPSSEVLTDAGRQIVELTARRLRGCTVKELTLLGLADPTGLAATNLTLSQHRADNVLEAFVKAGLPVPKYTLVAAGDKGAVTAGGAVVPVRRQVDVTVVMAR